MSLHISAGQAALVARVDLTLQVLLERARRLRNLPSNALSPIPSPRLDNQYQCQFDGRSCKKNSINMPQLSATGTRSIRAYTRTWQVTVPTTETKTSLETTARLPCIFMAGDNAGFAWVRLRWVHCATPTLNPIGTCSNIAPFGEQYNIVVRQEDYTGDVRFSIFKKRNNPQRPKPSVFSCRSDPASRTAMRVYIRIKAIPHQPRSKAMALGDLAVIRHLNGFG